MARHADPPVGHTWSRLPIWSSIISQRNRADKINPTAIFLEESASFIVHFPFMNYRNRQKYLLMVAKGSRETTDGLQEPGIWFALEKSTVAAGLDGGFRLPYLAI